jgi:hypothetical protein
MRRNGQTLDVRCAHVRRVAACRQPVRLSSSAWSAVLDGTPAMLIEPQAVLSPPVCGAPAEPTVVLAPPSAGMVIGWSGDMLLALACDGVEFFPEGHASALTLDDQAIASIINAAASSVPMERAS